MNAEKIQAAVAALPHFRRSMYGDLDVLATLEYMQKRYIDPIKRLGEISEMTLVDCGAGYGWLSFAYLQQGGKQAILCDVNYERLATAREIARILQVDDRCHFVCSPMQELQLVHGSVDIFASVETLEHVGNEHIDQCVRLMASTARHLIILTTPNKLFPVEFHDTRVPFAHWLPHPVRRRYVRLFGKVDRGGNDFVSPWRLRPISRQFKPVSTVLTFPTLHAWEASYPFQSPYGKGNRWRKRPPAALKALYGFLAALLGTHSYVLSPNLCRVWQRKEKVIGA